MVDQSDQNQSHIMIPHTETVVSPIMNCIKETSPIPTPSPLNTHFNAMNLVDSLTYRSSSHPADWLSYTSWARSAIGNRSKACEQWRLRFDLHNPELSRIDLIEQQLPVYKSLKIKNSNPNDDADNRSGFEQQICSEFECFTTKNTTRAEFEAIEGERKARALKSAASNLNIEIDLELDNLDRPVNDQSDTEPTGPNKLHDLADLGHESNVATRSLAEDALSNSSGLHEVGLKPSNPNLGSSFNQIEESKGSRIASSCSDNQIESTSRFVANKYSGIVKSWYRLNYIDGNASTDEYPVTQGTDDANGTVVNKIAKRPNILKLSEEKGSMSRERRKSHDQFMDGNLEEFIEDLKKYPSADLTSQSVAKVKEPDDHFVFFDDLLHQLRNTEKSSSREQLPKVRKLVNGQKEQANGHSNDQVYLDDVVPSHQLNENPIRLNFEHSQSQPTDNKTHSSLTNLMRNLSNSSTPCHQICAPTSQSLLPSPFCSPQKLNHVLSKGHGSETTLSSISSSLYLETMRRQSVSQRQKLPLGTMLCAEREQESPTNKIKFRPSLGPFLTTLLTRIENLPHNCFYANLYLTNLLSSLATYPQPLLRAILFLVPTEDLFFAQSDLASCLNPDKDEESESFYEFSAILPFSVLCSVKSQLESYALTYDSQLSQHLSVNGIRLNFEYLKQDARIYLSSNVGNHVHFEHKSVFNLPANGFPIMEDGRRQSDTGKIKRRFSLSWFKRKTSSESPKSPFIGLSDDLAKPKSDQTRDTFPPSPGPTTFPWLPDTASPTHQTSTPKKRKYRLPRKHSKKKSVEENSRETIQISWPKTQRIVLSAVIFEDFCKEMAALCMEHSINHHDVTI